MILFLSDLDRTALLEPVERITHDTASRPPEASGIRPPDGHPALHKLARSLARLNRQLPRFPVRRIRRHAGAVGRDTNGD